MSGLSLSAFSSRFCPLRTSRQAGDDAVSRTTSAVGLDDTPYLEYHRTNTTLQLLKNGHPFFTAHPPTKVGFGRTDRTNGLQATPIATPFYENRLAWVKSVLTARRLAGA